MLLAYRIVQLIVFLSSCVTLVSLFRFVRIIKSSENKYVYEIEPQLNAILRLLIASGVITAAFGIAGLILKVLITS